MALVRYVLSKENVDLGQTTIQADEEQRIDDLNILTEAAIRDKQGIKDEILNVNLRIRSHCHLLDNDYS